MNPVAFDTDAFMRAQIESAATHHQPDGGAHNAAAEWWPEPQLGLGATWWVATVKPRIRRLGGLWLCADGVAPVTGYGFTISQAYEDWRAWSKLLPA